LVIQNGRIIEHGSHAQLMQLNGHCHLFSLQARGYQ
jgi:ATP-binding cassette subfamily B protein